jgi:hypothetical protein
MGKFHSNVGFAEQYERTPGVWANRIVEREYYGDTLSAFYNTQPSTDTTNDDLKLNNKLSIVSDSYAIEHFQMIKYIVFMGVKWKVTGVELQYPRLILSIGGVYNAKSANST